MDYLFVIDEVYCVWHVTEEFLEGFGVFCRFLLAVHLGGYFFEHLLVVFEEVGLLEELDWV